LNLSKSLSELYSAFAASFKEKKTCLCGKEYLYKDCYYLNSTTRLPNWQGKQEIFNKINEILNKPELRIEKLKYLLWKWFKYDSDSSNYSNSTTTPKEIPKETLDETPENIVSDATLESFWHYWHHSPLTPLLEEQHYEQE